MIRRKVKSDILPKAYNEILPIADEKKGPSYSFTIHTRSISPLLL